MAPGALVEAEWLIPRLGEPGLRVVDTRWRLGEPGAGERAYEQGHIPGATFLDVDRDLSAAPGRRGRHPLPAPADFERAARAAGIHDGDLVVACDDAELGGAARLWWLLRHFGHDRAAVLNGGLGAWVAPGGELEPGRPAVPPGDFRARPRPDDSIEAEDLPGAPVVLDARAPERFRGESEPIDPVAGHVPGARNLPFAELAPGGRYGDPAELRRRLAAAGAGEDGFVAYCGSGVSACTLVVAAAAAGIRGARLYPGSWSEWSARGLPAERGAVR
jgi:thiosulfate/3-mercaptopyruvate sulfurtransferase